MDNVTRLLMQGAAGASGDKTYIDDLFSTYLYSGTAGSQSINTGLDMTEGGLTWIKVRTQSGFEHALFDTERGNNVLQSNSNIGQVAYADGLTSFNNNGFTLGADTSRGVVNQGSSGWDYTSWSFRKQKGFFDVVTYTGNDTNRTISHSLGCVPGFMMIKRLDDYGHWRCYHKDRGPTKHILLSASGAEVSGSNSWNNTAPTASVFSLGTATELNNNGSTYVAYLFAGGESTAATARSVVCDASGDYLSLGSSSDLAMGTGDFTIEGWYKINAKQNFGFFMNGPSGLSSTYGTVVWNYTGSGYGLQFITSGGYQATGFTPPPDQWFHLALVRNSGTTSLYYNGELLKAAADTTNYTNTTFQIGGYDSSPYLMNGSVSNFRIVKGTAVYTSSFRVPTEPLTAITNTVLLCCNNSSTTGSTVTPGTITANGDPTASTDSPFDDPEGFQFGEEGDQNIFKCGSYIGNGSSNGHDINMGWEPQWFIVKNVTSSNTNWLLFDSMRGLTDSDQSSEANIRPNTADSEWDNEYLSPTSRGFRLTNGGSTWVNESGSKFIYIAIRRPDGLVGKPPEAGTDAFAMDAGAGSSTIPNFDSGFPVDFAFEKTIAGGNSWSTGARLIQGRYLYTNTDMAAGTWDKMVFDSNTGWNNNSSYGSGDQSWMWKRGAGFDVVTWNGNGVTGRNIPHSMGKTPEMMWVKRRSNTEDWTVYHYGQNGGTNPEQYRLRLNSAVMNYTGTSYWNDTAPTSTHFTVGADGAVNNSGNTFIGILFASVAGISKLGNWVGDGGTQTITLGFQPRFLLLKTWNTGGGWYMLDTRRGWGAGNDASLQLQEGNAQVSSRDDGAPTATGFTVTGDVANEVGRSYIYYAHA